MSHDIRRDDADAFIAQWAGVNASELSTSQSFLIDLCALLGVPRPHPTPEQDYMFERPLTFRHADGSSSAGRVDLYRRGAFVLESKKIKAGAHTRGFDEAMLRAHSQAQNYARALPAAEGRPPFLVVVDVGQRIELYAEFSRSGGSYVPFPDPRSHRIGLPDLRDDAIRERLRKVWLDPLALDPSRESARVTRDIAARLAALARSLEEVDHAPDAVAQFLMRCLFTMFAEDVRLLPAESFRGLLTAHRERPDVAMRMLAQLWTDMDGGGFSAVLAGDVLRFNGKLFKQPDTLPLDTAQIDLLIDAARADWRHVEPAIFGTLLERALSPGERHKLGAHYTPRAYVERLVLPSVIEPLRGEWSNTQAAALTLAAEGKPDEAVAELLKFHHRLCSVRVLDPACGSGNFLYVTLEHLKRLEGEVLNTLDELGHRQTGLALGGERADARAGETVDPHNLLGIELNPRAAAIAEVVLWIGYLQWHFRTRGDVNPPQPVIRDFRNIENRDAVLAYDRVEFVTDEHGEPVTRWDGVTMKPSQVTGEPVPDESARKPVERYVNPRKAAWPAADFVVGNPPFIGNKRMRTALGDGYVEALRGAWPEVPETSDFVMYWWHRAAQLAQRGALQRFGLITTNSISQTFNRRVVEAALKPLSPRERGRGEGAAGAGRPPAPPAPSSGAARHLLPEGEGNEHALSLVFAIPDHPWVDSGDGAAVRISMTTAEGSGTGKVGAMRGGDPITGGTVGRLLTVVQETIGTDDEVDVVLSERRGVIHSDLSVGAKVVAAVKLLANGNVCFQGMNLVGKGFRLEPSEVSELGYDLHCLPDVIKPHCNARDLMQGGEHCYVIDLFGLTADEAREQHPALYQRLLDRVKPERDHNNRESRRKNWWVFGEPVGKLRKAWADLSRVMLTPETSKHRAFSFIDLPFCPDHKLYAICLDDALWLGVLSSVVHKCWALSAGGRLGVGNDPTWTNTTCFASYPFPDPDDAELPARLPSPPGRRAGDEGGLASDPPHHREVKARIRSLAEQLDAHRKRQQAAHPDLTLTGMYNVLEKLRSGEPLTAKERVIHEHGLVSVLRQLHDELDAAVLEAYGWSDLTPLLRIAHGNDALPPSPPGRRAGDEGGTRRSLPKAPLPNEALAFARELRRSQTDAEALMWGLLRDRRLHGAKFRRQHPWPPYTLDFYCAELRLAVELDGSQHADSARDARRDAALAAAGISVVRYWNHDVLQRTESVLEDLWGRVEARAPSPPTPLPAGEGSRAAAATMPWNASDAALAAITTRDEARRAFAEAILERLVALNAERAAEEARGLVRWLRPEFQNPQGRAGQGRPSAAGTGCAGAAAAEAPLPAQGTLDARTDEASDDSDMTAPTASKPLPWPKDAVDQVRAVAELLAASPMPLSLDDIGRRFTARGPWKKRLPQLLQMLTALGRASEDGGRYRAR